ncbi:hypothetical protein L917_07838 [Phytophthora nicotianae]|uniref:Uncharacterized protein n=2 Tax=Phytophthora nicotianae TaxID=4792 RepID=W2L9W0_PHYNI|nr:hypothetical protein L917_07838 [Phytophthora nicotianae]ETO76355.1 hypothetical protein F444_08244 [Phytophthora nicotianae P1976]
MAEHARNRTAAPNAPRSVSKATSMCEYCSKTRHQNSCKNKQKHVEATAKPPFQFPIHSNTVFEYLLKFMSNQTLIKLQIATGDHYSGCEPDLAKYCCSCENDNPVIIRGLCLECESSLPGYMPRMVKEMTKNKYGDYYVWIQVAMGAAPRLEGPEEDETSCYAKVQGQRSGRLC